MNTDKIMELADAYARASTTAVLSANMFGRGSPLSKAKEEDVLDARSALVMGLLESRITKEQG